MKWDSFWTKVTLYAFYIDFKNSQASEHLDTPVADELLLFGSVQPNSLITLAHSIHLLISVLGRMDTDMRTLNEKEV